MQIPPKGGRVSRRHHRSRSSKNGSSKSRRDCSLANTSNGKRREKLPRLLQLLPHLHSPLFKCGMTPKRPHQEEPKMGMDRHYRMSLPEAEADMCFIFSTINPRLELSVHLRNRCFWIRTRSCHHAGI